MQVNPTQVRDQHGHPEYDNEIKFQYDIMLEGKERLVVSSPPKDLGLNSIHFRVLTKMFTKILMKIVTKKLSKSYTKNFMKLEVGTCLLFKFGFVKIFVKIFVRILKCI